jgi:hypothetical protein
MIKSLHHFATSDVAKERLRILAFYEQFGESATKQGFGVDRKTVWVWKKKMQARKGHIAALVPHSTRPKRIRTMQTDPRIVAYIRELRLLHPRLGKEKVKPLLDTFCRHEKLSPLAISTIGKVIKRNNLFSQPSGRVYHDATRKRPVWKTKRQRVKRMPKTVDQGYIQMDTVVRFVDGIKVYLYSAISVSTKFAFSYHYKSLTSTNMVDFFKKVQQVFPFTITTIQTDNGLEFLGAFEKYLQTIHIAHVFIYPRCCKVNGVVERYQRSLQEEFFDNHLEFVYDPILLNDKLMEYLLFYNTLGSWRHSRNTCPATLSH